MRLWGITAGTAGICLLVWTAGPAVPDLEMGVGNKTTLTGELDPPAEVETILVDLPAGARLKAIAKGLKGGAGQARVTPVLHVEDEDDKQSADGITRKTKAKLPKFTAKTSGMYRIAMSGADATPGLYELKVSWKSPRGVKLQVPVTDQGGAVPFAADAGSLASFKVKNARGSLAEPRLLEVVYDGGGFTHVFAPGKAQVVRNVELPFTGDYTLRLMNAVPDAGNASAAVKLKAPKVEKTRALVTSQEVPPVPPGIDPELYAEIIGLAGGELDVSSLSGGTAALLEGAQLLIPEGATPLPIAFFVRPDTDIDPNDPKIEPRGPALFYGPDGHVFDEDVIVVLPFDPEGFDPADLLVFERDSSGVVTQVPPEGYTISLGPPATVAFPFRHFTTFQAFGPVGIQEVFADDFETFPADWFADNGIWQIGEPTTGPGAARSGVNAAATVLDGTYPDFTDSGLVGPKILLPQVTDDEVIEFRFWHWHSIHHFDIARPQVAVETSPGVLGPFQSVTSYSRVSPVWTQTRLDLSHLAGMVIRPRLLLDQSTLSFESGVSTGWYVDDVTVEIHPVRQVTAGAPYVQGFEQGYDGWYASNGLWEVGLPTSGPGEANTGQGAAATMLNANYQDFTSSSLVSPQLRLPSISPGEEVRATYWHWFSIHHFDSAQVQVYERLSPGTFDGGATLRTHTRSSGAWTQSFVDLSAYAGRVVVLVFHLRQSTFSFEAGTGAGWYVDDVVVEAR